MTQMNGQNDTNKRANYEFDLLDLWHVIQKRKIIICMISLTLFGGTWIHLHKKPMIYRTSNVLVVSHFISPAEVKASIDVLNNFSNSQKNMMLNLNDGQLSNIVSVSVSLLDNVSALKVDVDSLNKDAGCLFIDALPEYVQRKSILSEKIVNQKDLLEKNIKDLHSLLESPNTVFRIPKDSYNSLIYFSKNDAYTLYEKSNQLNIVLNAIEKDQLVSLADKTEKPKNPITQRGFHLLMIIAIGAVFLALCIVFFMEMLINLRR